MPYPLEINEWGDMTPSEHQAQHQGCAESTTSSLTHIRWRMLIWIISLGIIAINVTVDIVTLILYYDSEEYAFFALTLIFLALPSLVIAVSSLIWLRDADKRLDENVQAEQGQFNMVAVLLHLTLLGLVYR